MSLMKDDWKGEHLIRAPKKESGMTRDQIMADFAAARLSDAARIRSVAQTMSQSEISRHLKITENRVCELCREFHIQTALHPQSSAKRAVK